MNKAECVSLSSEHGAAIWDLIRGKADPEQYESVQRWRAQCYNWPPSRPEMVMCAIDELLGTHGVEAIRSETLWDRYHGDVTHTYCNTGDMYATTVVFDCRTEEYMVTDIGTLLEDSPDE